MYVTIVEEDAAIAKLVVNVVLLICSILGIYGVTSGTRFPIKDASGENPRREICPDKFRPGYMSFSSSRLFDDSCEDKITQTRG